MQDPIQPAVPAIRVRASLTAALNMLTVEWRKILKIILMPYILMTLSWTPVMLNFIPVMNSGQTPDPAVIQALFLQNIPWFILGGLISTLIYAYMVTALMRFFVLSEHTHSWILSYHANMWQYLWRKIMISFVYLLSTSAGFFLIIIPSVALDALHASILSILWAILSAIALLLAIPILMTRLSLAPSAAALGEDDRLSISWQHTRGQVIRISLVWSGFILVVLCVYLVSGLIELVLGLLPGMLKTSLIVVKSAIVSGGIFAFATALQTIVYVHFYGRPVNQTENTHVL